MQTSIAHARGSRSHLRVRGIRTVACMRALGAAGDFRTSIQGAGPSPAICIGMGTVPADVQTSARAQPSPLLVFYPRKSPARRRSGSEPAQLRMWGIVSNGGCRSRVFICVYIYVRMVGFHWRKRGRVSSGLRRPSSVVSTRKAGDRTAVVHSSMSLMRYQRARTPGVFVHRCDLSRSQWPLNGINKRKFT